MSLLYRKHVPASMQSPSSASLAALLGVVGFDETELLQGGCLRPPPALYHYAGTITLYQYAVPLRRYHYAVPLRRRCTITQGRSSCAPSLPAGGSTWCY